MKTKKKKETIQRAPRPKGFTNLCIHYLTNPTNNNLKKLRHIALTCYISNQWYKVKPVEHPIKTTSTVTKEKQRYVLLPYDIEDIARTIGLKVYKAEERLVGILAKQAKGLASSGAWDDLLDHSRASTFSIFFGALNRLNKVTGWEEELMEASRANYHKPGYAMAATSAIGQTNQYQAQVLKMMAPFTQPPQPSKPTTTVNIQNNHIPGHLPVAEEGSITIDQAVSLLADHNAAPLPLNNRKEHFAHLADKYLTEDIPSVTANQSDAQGISRNTKYEYLRQAINHDTRREEETGPILDALD